MNSMLQPAIANSRTISYRWWALIALALAQFLVVLDASIVNIALPSLGSELHLSTNTLSWVITAYVLPFAGLLLLGFLGAAAFAIIGAIVVLAIGRSTSSSKVSD